MKFAVFLLIALFSIASVQCQSELLTEENIVKGLLSLVNEARKRTGAGSLCLNQPTHLRKLINAAKAHTEWMARTGTMSHTGRNGSSPSERISNANYSWRSIGENVATGQNSVAEVMRDWMNSQGHRENILDPDYSQFGAAMVDDFWTQTFARPTNIEQEPCIDSPSTGNDNGNEGNIPPSIPDDTPTNNDVPHHRFPTVRRVKSGFGRIIRYPFGLARRLFQYADNTLMEIFE